MTKFVLCYNAFVEPPLRYAFAVDKHRLWFCEYPVGIIALPSPLVQKVHTLHYYDPLDVQNRRSFAFLPEIDSPNSLTMRHQPWKSARFRVGQILNPYRSHYSIAFASFGILYPHRLRLTLRSAFQSPPWCWSNTGLPCSTSYSVWVRLLFDPGSTPSAFWYVRHQKPDCTLFSPSLTASFGLSQLTRLHEIHIILAIPYIPSS